MKEFGKTMLAAAAFALPLGAQSQTINTTISTRGASLDAMLSQASPNGCGMDIANVHAAEFGSKQTGNQTGSNTSDSLLSVNIAHMDCDLGNFWSLSGSVNSPNVKMVANQQRISASAASVTVPLTGIVNGVPVEDTAVVTFQVEGNALMENDSMSQLEYALASGGRYRTKNTASGAIGPASKSVITLSTKNMGQISGPWMVNVSYTKNATQQISIKKN
jgi:hypothetical protein